MPPAAMHAFFEQLGRDEHVVGRGLGIVEDGRELSQVTGAEEVRDLEHRGLGEQGERLGVDLHEPRGPRPRTSTRSRR